MSDIYENSVNKLFDKSFSTDDGLEVHVKTEGNKVKIIAMYNNEQSEEDIDLYLLKDGYSLYYAIRAAIKGTHYPLDENRKAGNLVFTVKAEIEKLLDEKEKLPKPGERYSEDVECINKRVCGRLYGDITDEIEIEIEEGQFYVRPKMKIYAEYGGKLYDDPYALHELSYRHITLREIEQKINNLKAKAKRIPLTEYVERNYPDDVKEMMKNPIRYWFKVSDTIFRGQYRNKLLLLQGVVLTRIPKLGLRINNIFLGESGEGKSKLNESILLLLEELPFFLHVYKLTPEVLTYVKGDVDGHIIFIDEVDDLESLKRLNTLLTENRHKALSTATDPNTGSRYPAPYESRGTYAVFTASTAMLINDNPKIAHQLATRTLFTYLRQNHIKSAIITAKKYQSTKTVKVEYDQKTRLLFAYFLATRPKEVTIPDEIKKKVLRDVIPYIKKTNKAYNRTVEIYEKMIHAHAMLHGRTVANEHDYQIVKKHFFAQIMMNGFGLTPQDLEVIKAIARGNITYPDISYATTIPSPDVTNICRSLMRKGFIYLEYDESGRKLIDIRLTKLGELAMKMFNDNETHKTKLTPEEIQMRKNQIFENFGFNAFSPAEYAKKMKIREEEAEEEIKQLLEAGIVTELYPKKNLYSLHHK